MAVHGYARTTEDLDVWVAVSPDNADRLVDLIRKFGFEGQGLTRDIFLKIPSIIRLGRPPVKIEIATAISGVRFDECFRDHIVVDFDDLPVKVIGLDHLKANKAATGRKKDLSDLDYLPGGKKRRPNRRG